MLTMKRMALTVIVLAGVVAICSAGGLLRRNGVRPPSPATALKPAELLAVKPPPNERYFLLVFGSQGTPLRPRYCHTWATAVKVTENPQTNALTVEQQTISWMPASLAIKPLRFKVEPGVNLDLHFTIEEMYRNGERVSLWGPYETWYGLHHRFLTQKKFLESGAVGYQCMDTLGEAHRNGTGCDCIHAISDMDPQLDRRQGYSLRKKNYGENASANIVSQIMRRPALIKPEITHDWLIGALDLEKYPIVRQPYSGPMAEFSPEAMLEAARAAGLAPPK